MNNLSFKVILIPQYKQEPDLPKLKLHVEQCRMEVLNMRKLELENSDNESFPDFIECVIEVTVVSNFNVSVRNKVSLYEQLCSLWCEETRHMTCSKPLLQLSQNECFVRKRKPRHECKQIYLSYGVHPSIGEFVCYHFSLDHCKALFFHDMSELEIEIEVIKDFNFLSGRYVVKSIRKILIPYDHIRNVIVDLRSTYFDLYLDLLHPPSSKLQEEKSHYMTLPYKIDKGVFGKSNVVRVQNLARGSWLEIINCLRMRCGRIPIHFVGMTVKDKTPPLSPINNIPHFGCTYLWEALNHRTFTMLEQTPDINESLRNLSILCRQNPVCLEKALTDVLFMLDSGRFANYWHAIFLLFAYYMARQEIHGFRHIPSKCRLIRRVTLTPTRVLLWPPDLMHENRILRNFDSEYFLRVTFRDDGLQTMNFRMYQDSVFQQVMSPMDTGLRIGDRLYEMLAWSSSQLREHGVSMYAKDSKGYNAHHIRRWTEIDPRTTMNIPKCLARMGQCFSQTEEAMRVPLDVNHVVVEGDIEGGWNPVTEKPYCFSDGVGKISSGLAEKVGNSLKHGRTCSAFQIRYGGCKGMLVIDPTLRDVDIVFRDSMKKFGCQGDGHTKLEIAQKSAPLRLRLNRQIIAILHDLGVDPAKFLRLQEDMLQNLTDMLLEEDKAAEYLNFRTPFSIFKINELSTAGIALTIEPFFKTLLLALHRYYIDLIKTKANIDINPAKGRNMFGVLDETGKLKYGEVFVQYSRDVSLGVTTPEDAIILKNRPVMVTKCPCVHAADVRKFKAIDVPELHHIVDCIVFPQKGPRPHPDEMAGSDLDGDQYSVHWDPELFFSGPNAEPPHYPKPTTLQFKNVTDFLLQSKTEQVTQFLTEYIKNDQIAPIASVHLARADELGIQKELCEKLAMKHSIAVDFAKTGCSSRLGPGDRPEAYPDFQEKFWNDRYKSKKSLGKMYRVSRDFEKENQSFSLKYQDVKVDPVLIVSGWEEYERSAIADRNEYNSTLKTILETYGITHETEAYGGAFIKLHARFNDRRDRAEIVNLVHIWQRELVEKTREQFFEEIKNIKDVALMERAVARQASAWYIVTYRERNPEFLSFPWVISDILSNVRMQNPKPVPRNVAPYTPLATQLEEKIYDTISMFPALSSEASVYLRQYKYFSCPRYVVEYAIRVLTKWGDDELIISPNDEPGKFLFYSTFLKIIHYVAEVEGYVSKQPIPDRPATQELSASRLILSFFKYCMKLRFLSKREAKSVLPFHVYNDRILAKRALVTFHSFALSGSIPTLCNQEFMDNQPWIVEMKPALIGSAIFGSSPVEEAKLQNAECLLQTHSEVEAVHLREICQKRKVVVSAYGTIHSLERLKYLIRKKNDFLRLFFASGEMPLINNN